MAGGFVGRSAELKSVFSSWRVVFWGRGEDADEPVCGGGRDCVPLGVAFSGHGGQRVPMGAPRDPKYPR
jgi:hypothetical protein